MLLMVEAYLGDEGTLIRRGNGTLLIQQVEDTKLLVIQ